MSAREFSCVDGIDFNPAAAVHRQARFALKMAQFGWLHSPTLRATLARAIVRYSRFFSLVGTANGPTVPTLDIDLVWHTHQLSPGNYSKFCRAATKGRFVDHNDRVEKESLDVGSQRTADLYREQFKGEYLLCHSWYCEFARTFPDENPSDINFAAIVELINQRNERWKHMRTTIALDRAQCHCYGHLVCQHYLKTQMSHDKTRPSGTCGSVCSKDCSSICSSAGCSDCRSTCSSCSPV